MSFYWQSGGSAWTDFVSAHKGQGKTLKQLSAMYKKTPAGKKSATKRKSPAKKTTTRKSPAKKTTTRKSPAKKAAKKSPAKKAAKKSPAKKATKKSPAKKRSLSAKQKAALATGRDWRSIHASMRKTDKILSDWQAEDEWDEVDQMLAATQAQLASRPYAGPKLKKD